MAHLNLPPTIRSFRPIIWLARELHKARNKVWGCLGVGQHCSQSRHAARAPLSRKKVQSRRTHPRPTKRFASALLWKASVNGVKRKKRTQTHSFEWVISKAVLRLLANSSQLCEWKKQHLVPRGNSPAFAPCLIHVLCNFLAFNNKRGSWNIIHP